MVRRLLVLVILAFGGCAPYDLPRPICIESRFSTEETALLVEAVGEANRELGGLIGGQVLALGEPITDVNGFDPNDFGDDVHAIYRVEKDDPVYVWLTDTLDKDLAGYATHGDVLIFADDAHDRSHAKGLILHEIGHFLGLMHSPDPGDVMHTPHGARAYTDRDKEAFCLVHYPRCE